MYYWPALDATVRRVVSDCDLCAETKHPGPQEKSPIHATGSEGVWHTMSFDFVPMDASQEGYNHLVFFVDHESKMPFGILTRSGEASEIPRA